MTAPAAAAHSISRATSVLSDKSLSLPPAPLSTYMPTEQGITPPLSSDPPKEGQSLPIHKPAKGKYPTPDPSSDPPKEGDKET